MIHHKFQRMGSQCRKEEEVENLWNDRWTTKLIHMITDCVGKSHWSSFHFPSYRLSMDPENTVMHILYSSKEIVQNISMSILLLSNTFFLSSTFSFFICLISSFSNSASFFIFSASLLLWSDSDVLCKSCNAVFTLVYFTVHYHCK